MADAVAVHKQGGALIERYQRTGDHRLLDEGVTVLREALRIGGLTETISTLASALVHRYETSRDPTDLDEAMALLTRLVDGPGVNLTQATEIVRIQRHWYDMNGDLAHLDQAVALAQGCIAQSDPGQRDYGVMQHLLGLALAERYERTRRLGDLEAAIAAHRIAAHSSAGRLRPGMLLNLAATLRARIAATGDLSVLEEAEAMVAGALAALPPTHPERVSAEWLAGALARYRSELTGDTDVLNDGIDALRRSVASTSDPDALTTRLDSLGTALMHQFEHTGDHAALSEAIDVMRETLKHPDSEPAVHLTSLGNALRLSYQRFGDLGALQEAVDVLREAVAAPAEQRAHSIALGSLAGALTDLGRRFPAVVGEAVTTARDLVADNDSADAREKLANALLLRFDATESRDDLIEAGELLEDVLRRRPPGNAEHAEALGGLGGFWQRVHDRTGTPETLNEAISYYGRAARVEQAPQRASYQYAFARLLLRQAEETGDGGRLHAAARAFAEAAGNKALDAVTRLLAAHSWSTAAARVGDWGQALRGAERVMALVPAVTTPGLAGIVADAAACACHAGQPALAVQWLEQGRGVQLGEPFEPAGERHPDGTIVLINVSALRCDALIVRPDAMELLPLNQLSFDEAVAQAERFSAAPAEVLEWLWDTVTGPVLSALPDETRLWWSPGGPLAVLPLHAAGRDGRAVLDYVVSSYTPTVHALRWACARAAEPPADPSMLVVAMPDTEGQPPLRHVHREVEALAELWEATELSGALATRSNVLAALQRHSHVHFACHGVSEAGNPAQSALLLADGLLTVRDIALVPLPSARLAVLPDCDIASAFPFAGYPSVVGALWRVENRIAATVAVAFHSALLDHGLDQPALALHDVVNELRAKHPPDVWAAYVHIGA